jgi:hypothetical protein
MRVLRLFFLSFLLLSLPLPSVLAKDFNCSSRCVISGSAIGHGASKPLAQLNASYRLPRGSYVYRQTICGAKGQWTAILHWRIAR